MRNQNYTAYAYNALYNCFIIIFKYKIIVKLFNNNNIYFYIIL